MRRGLGANAHNPFKEDCLVFGEQSQPVGQQQAQWPLMPGETACEKYDVDDAQPLKEADISSAPFESSSEQEGDDFPKKEVRALVLINLQIDWVDGNVAILGALDAVEVCNGLRAHAFDYVYVCDTLHPATGNHCSFRSNHPGSLPDEVLFLTASGDSQRMRPDHCVSGTRGARPHPRAIREPSDIRCVTGRDPRKDSYSAFKDNDSRHLSDMAGSLLANAVSEMYVAGLATDQAVQYTVEDARLFVEDVNIYVVEDACKGLSKEGVERTFEALKGEKGVCIVRSDGPELRKIPLRKLRPCRKARKCSSLSPFATFGWELNRSRTIHHMSVSSDVDALYEAVLEGLSHNLVIAPLAFKVVRLGLINSYCSWSSRTILHACAEMGDSRTLKLLCSLAWKNLNGQKDSNGGEQGPHRGQSKQGTISGFLSKDNELNLLSVTPDGENVLITCILRCSRRSSRLKFTKALLNLITAEERKLLVSMPAPAELNMNALMAACCEGDLDVAELLLNVDSSLKFLRKRSKYGATALMLAASKDTPECAALVEVILTSQAPGPHRLALLSQKDCEKWTVLHLAAKSGCFAKVNWVHAMGGRGYLTTLPVNARTSGAGFSMLQLAAWNGHDQVIRSLIDIYPDTSAISAASAAAAEEKDKTKMSIGSELPSRLLEPLQVNREVMCTSDRNLGDMELDLAIKRRHLKCARLLLRLGCYANSCSGTILQELLHRLVLMGDLEGCEAILDQPDENAVVVDEALIVVTQRMEAPETCTFSFSNSTHPAKQFLTFCILCKQHVCLVCADKCHGTDEGQCSPLSTATTETLALVAEKDTNGWGEADMMMHYCKCARASCCASNAGADDREKTARNFQPQPVDTQDVLLDYNLLKLVRLLARNMHNVWANDKVQNGWKYSKTRDDTRKHHPLLLSFDALSDEDRAHNVDVAAEAVKVIIALGFAVVKDSKISKNAAKKINQSRAGQACSEAGNTKHRILESSNGSFLVSASATVFGSSSSGDSSSSSMRPVAQATNNYAHSPSAFTIASHGIDHELQDPAVDSLTWHLWSPGCAPIDNSDVVLPNGLDDLVGHIAKNSHEVWAAEKISKGFRYAPAHKIQAGLKLTSDLIPFESLSAREQDDLRHGANETLKSILYDGWTVKRDECLLSIRRFSVLDINSSEFGASYFGSSRDHMDSGSTYQECSSMSNSTIPQRASDSTVLTRRTLPQLRTSDVCHNLVQTRSKFFDQYLFATARRGNLKSLHILISTQRFGQPQKLSRTADVGTRKRRNSMSRRMGGADLNVRDSFGQTPLYIAVKRGHSHMVKWLLSLNVHVNTTDINGFSPLAIAAYLGNTGLCKALVSYDADLLSVDRMGFTPIHHAAHQGHLTACALLAESLQALYQSNHIVNLNASLLASEQGHEGVVATEKKARLPYRDSSKAMNLAIAGGIVTSQNPSKMTEKQQVAKSRLGLKPAVRSRQVAPNPTSLPATDYNFDEEENFSDTSSQVSGDNDGVNNVAGMLDDSVVSLAVLGRGFVKRENILDCDSVRSNTGRNLKGGKNLTRIMTPYSPLSIAVFAEQNAIIEMLLKCDADPMYGDGRQPNEAEIGTTSIFSIASSSNNLPSPYIRALRKHVITRSAVHTLKAFLAERAEVEVMARRKQSERPHDDLRGPVVASTRMSCVRRRRISAPSSINRNHKRNLPQDMAEEISMRELNQALTDKTAQHALVTETVKVLNCSKQVRRWRNRLAMFKFGRELFSFALAIVCFTFFVQLSPDYDNNSELMWRTAMFEQLKDSTKDVASRQDLLDWLAGTLLEQNAAYNNETAVLTLYGFNHMYGPIRVERTDHPFHSEDFDGTDASLAETLALWREQKFHLASTVISTQSMHEQFMYLQQMPVGSMATAVRISNSTRNDGGRGFAAYIEQAQRLAITINIYNPYYEVYGIATVELTAPFYSEPQLKIEVLQFRLHHGRFPPSREFQGMTLILACLTVGIAVLRTKHFVSAVKTGAHGQGLLWGVLLLCFFSLDVWLFAWTKDLVYGKDVYKARSGEYVSLQDAYEWVMFERHSIGVLLFFSTVPVLSVGRSIPSIGPVVVALLNTITSKSVIIYLAVVGAAYMVIAMSMFQAFGAQVAWSSLARTYSQLFLTPFIERWDNTTEVYETSSHGIFLAVFYIFFAITSTNLMVAVVTDVYPKERIKSESRWEELITASIERRVAAQSNHVDYAGKNKNWLRAAFATLITLPPSAHILEEQFDIPYWKPEEVLCGRDGFKYWTPGRLNSSGKQPKNNTSNRTDSDNKMQSIDDGNTVNSSNRKSTVTTRESVNTAINNEGDGSDAHRSTCHPQKLAFSDLVVSQDHFFNDANLTGNTSPRDEDHSHYQQHHHHYRRGHHRGTHVASIALVEARLSLLETKLDLVLGALGQCNKQQMLPVQHLPAHQYQHQHQHQHQL